MNFAFLLASVVALLVSVASQTQTPILGGYSTADPKSAAVRKAASFGISETYQAGTTTHRVLTAKMQVVAGYKYDMNVAVTFKGNKSCSMQNYVVWQLPVMTTYQLMSKKQLRGMRCTN